MNRNKMADERPTNRAFVPDKGGRYVSSTESPVSAAEGVNLNRWAKVPLWVLQYPDKAIRIYAVLAAERDKQTGCSSPGYDRICKLAKAHRDTVAKYLRVLREGGAIVAAGRSGFGPNGGNDRFFLPLKDPNQSPGLSDSGSEGAQIQRPGSAVPTSGFVGLDTEVDIEEEEARSEAEGCSSSSGAPEVQPDHPTLVLIAERLFSTPEGALTATDRQAFHRGRMSGAELSEADVEVIERYREANPGRYLECLPAFLAKRHEQLKKARDWDRAPRRKAPVKTSPDAKAPRPLEPWQIEKDIKRLIDRAKAIKNNKANYDWSGDVKAMLPDAEAELDELKRKHAELKAQLPSKAELNEGLPA